VTIDSCWSFRNGINVWNDAAFAGDGNAFKMGGAGDTAEHMITRSLAFDNAHNGFDQNYNNAGQTIYNCTAFRNGTSNFSFYQTPTAGKLKKHILKNNISYLGGAPNIDATATQEANSWQGNAATASDFASLDTALALAPRNADYSLPETGFLKLHASSQFVDKGVDVGLAYYGKAPDLGAFETTGSTRIISGPEAVSVRGIKIAYSAVNGLLKFTINVPVSERATLSLFDPAGKKLYGSGIVRLNEGNNDLSIDSKRPYEGAYFYKLTCGSKKFIGRVVSE
jgi:hypothetical protein